MIITLSHCQKKASFCLKQLTLYSFISDCGSLISSLSSSATPSDGTNRDAITSNGRIPCSSSLPLSPNNDVSCSLSDLPPPYSLIPQSPNSGQQPLPSSMLVAVRTSGTLGGSRTPGNVGIGSVTTASRTIASTNMGGARLAGARANGDVFVIGNGDNGCITGYGKVYYHYA